MVVPVVGAKVGVGVGIGVGVGDAGRNVEGGCGVEVEFLLVFP